MRKKVERGVIALVLSAVVFIILGVFWKLANASADLIHGATNHRTRGGEPASGEDHS